jgi:hypothetical protein
MAGNTVEDAPGLERLLQYNSLSTQILSRLQQRKTVLPTLHSHCKLRSIQPCPPSKLQMVGKPKEDGPGQGPALLWNSLPLRILDKHRPPTTVLPTLNRQSKPRSALLWLPLKPWMVCKPGEDAPSQGRAPLWNSLLLRTLSKQRQRTTTLPKLNSQ